MAFFPMRGDDRWYLRSLIGFSIVAFLPPWRELHVAGMAVFGWLMAALMVFSPSIALALLLRRSWKRGL